MKTVRIGLLGCGTVGGGVLQLLRENGQYLAAKVGAPMEVARVLVRDPKKPRVSGLPTQALTTNPEDIFSDPSIDVIVEVMGGVDPARAYVERAIATKRSVVTANKMLLAKHGPEILGKAAEAGVDVGFEGSVGGGIPVIRVLREALVSDWVNSLAGIVNGTCNFVLTRMQRDGLPFETAVREAQEKGYAEADPSLDVDGHDAAHKLVVLAMLAFGAKVDHGAVPTEGIRQIEPIDHRFAARFGFTIKHLAVGRDAGKAVELRVHPALVAEDTPLANVSGVLNAVALEGRALGPCLLSGRGAGDLPTAVSVVADIVDVSRARINGAAGLTTRAIALESRPVAPLESVICRYYLRFVVYDRPGVLAAITGALGKAGVSIEQMVQEGRGDSAGAPVQVVLLTHEATEGDVRRALGSIATMDFVADKTRVLRVHENRKP